MKDLKALFEPKTVAVVGVSEDKTKVGRVIFDNLRASLKDQVFAINPKHDKIGDFSCFKSVKYIDQAIDLAIICIPAPLVAGAIGECLEAGIKNAIIISSGFSEIGATGKKLAEQVLAAAKEQVNILGPNTLGFYNLDLGLNATFAAYQPEAGSVSFISQSGAFQTAFLDWANQEKVGLSKAICIGNKLNLSENDILEYLAQDPQTKVIALYLESFKSGQELLRLAKEIGLTKPLVILKAGKTEAGKDRAASHTASMSGSAQVASRAFQSANMLETQTMEEFFNLVYLLSRQVEIKTNRVGVITNAGGPGVILTDMLETSKLELAQISAATEAKFKAVLPPHAALKNPIDIIGDAQPERYQQTLAILQAADEVDLIINLVSPQSMTDIAGTAEVIKASQAEPVEAKPIISCFLGGQKTQEAKTKLSSTSLPVFSFLEPMVKSLASVYQYYQQRQRLEKNLGLTTKTQPDQVQLDQVKALIKADQQAKKSRLGPAGIKLLAEIYTLNLPQEQVVKTEAEALAEQAKIKGPVVLKSLDIHKTDDQQVYLNLTTEADLIQAFKHLRLITQEPLLLQQMIPAGVELLLGSSQDPDFGPVVSFGLGGIYTEALKQTVQLLPPVELESAQRLIKAQSFYPLFNDGYRGLKKAEVQVWQTLINFSQMVADLAEIKSLEINPLIVTQDNVYAVDFNALFQLESLYEDNN